MRIRDLAWSTWSIDHIARHGVEVDEVEDVAFNRNHYATQLRHERYLVVGQTAGGRYLSVIVDRVEAGRFFVVTARTAAPRERRLYDRS